MKINQRVLALGVIALALAWTGCLFSPKTEDPKPDLPYYAQDLSVPDSLIFNLLESYTRKEINHYAALLARDYKFQFQEPDNDFPNGMNFTQDSTSTYNMFSSTNVNAIDLTMDTKPPVSAKFEGEDTKLVEIYNLLLDVHTSKDAITYRVSQDIQEYHMVLGNAAAGEDTSRYYIRAWRDIGGQAAPKRPPLLTRIQQALDQDEGARVVNVSMSELHKAMSDLQQLTSGKQ